MKYRTIKKMLRRCERENRLRAKRHWPWDTTVWSKARLRVYMQWFRPALHRFCHAIKRDAVTREDVTGA